MSPKNLCPMIAILLILGGAVFGLLGGLHAIYTLLDLRQPRRLVPVVPLHTRWPIPPSDSRVGARTCGEPGLALTSATVLVYCYLPRWRSGPGPESTRSPSVSCQHRP